MDDMWTANISADDRALRLAQDGATASADWAQVSEIRERVNVALSEHQRSTTTAMPIDAQKQLAMKLIVAELDRLSLARAESGAPLMDEEVAADLRKAVMDSMFKLGRLQKFVDDPDIEAVYIRGAQPVIVKYAGGRRKMFPPVADSAEDLMNQLSQMAAHQGQNARVVSSAQPWLNLRLPGQARLAAVWDLTPEPIVTIRRHRYVDVTLKDLVAMGMLSRSMMAYLEACIQAKRSILIVGPQGAGKTTFLRALCRCFPATARFATLETEYELLLHEIPGVYPGLLPVEERPGTGELDAAGRPTGEVTLADYFPNSLRHDIDFYIFGETRGREVFPMLQCMTRGARGSMGTFHADGAIQSFDALSSLMSEYKDNWSSTAAMQQIANALDVVVFLDREEVLDGSEQRYVAEIIEVGRVGADGQPSHTFIFQPDEALEETDPRGYAAGMPADKKWPRRAGLDLAWLKRENSSWDQPFPQRWGSQ